VTPNPGFKVTGYLKVEYLADYLFTLRVAVCAVAQHCYNGDVSFLWEKWKL